MQSEFDDERGDFGGPTSDDIPRRVQAASNGEAGEGGGLELIGGVLFLVGCLPAAAVAKALMDGTDLSAEGLGGTAALASMVSGWVGPWPALAIAASVAVIGALMVIGSLRTEPLRYVAGAAVSGFGLAAIASALVPGAGGQLGEGTGGAITQALGGSWAGILLGLAVIAASVWFAFVMPTSSDEHGPFDDDDFGPVHDEADGFGVGATIAGAVSGAVAGAKALGGRLKSRVSSRANGEAGGDGAGLGRGGQRRRKIQAKSKRRANPVTLGDVLASGGSEGVSHDEAAALAPDDKALKYMEDVWRRASDSYPQAEPIPRSPYPEDVRLRGEIPEGAAPLSAVDLAKKEGAEAQGAADRDQRSGAPAQPPQHAPAAPSLPVPVFGPPDIAPFDFHDAPSSPMPMVDAPTAQASLAQAQPNPVPAQPNPVPAQPSLVQAPFTDANDPFSAPGPGSNGLSQLEADAHESAVRREGASAVGPKELPDGVTHLVPKSASEEAFVPAPPPMASSVEEVLADPAEIDRAGDVSAQAMLAGAMPAEVMPPPLPAWETGYAEEDGVFEETFPDPEVIAEVDPTGRWPRREDDLEDEPEVAFAPQEILREKPAEVAPAKAEVFVVANVAVDGDEIDEEEIAEAEFEDDEPTAEPEAELEDDEEEDVEWVDEDGNPIDPEDLGEEYELVEEDEDEEDDDDEAEEAAELEEDEEEEYEYVDEDGNPIDPEDVDEEWEVVEDSDDEEDEKKSALAEESEPVSSEESSEEESPAEVAAADDAEWEEDWDEAAEDEAAEDGAAEDLEVAEPTVILEPKAPPAASLAAPAGPLDADSAADSEPDSAAASEAASEVESAAEPAAAAPEPVSLPGTGDPLLGAVSASADGQRLLAAGRIVVQEGRVAVSLLQREFDMEFDEACAVLDELQQEGLIGPYKGGKARDILLTAEEWEGRFAHS